jgi:2-polyprenyl-6-methoxyphenol hydroxylase-like FAD-dependent oxidoreductase
MYDVIVVGARCAGSPTAMLLARKGYRVLLVDKARFPSNMVLSTHCIWQGGTAALDRWGLLDQVRASNCPPSTSVRLDFGSMVVAGTPAPAGNISEAFCPRRTVLDKILVDAAGAAGAELREDCIVNELLWDGQRVTGIRGTPKDGRRFTADARIVIGADGMHSTIARLVSAQAYNVWPEMTFSYFSYWPGLTLDHIEVYPHEGCAPFAWMTNDGMTLVGVNWPIGERDRVRADVEGHFFGALASIAPRLADQVRGAPRAERWLTGSVSSFFRTAAGPGWALVGDAAYKKDPITAAGITDAFRDAQALADAVDAGLGGQSPMADALADHQRRRDADALPFYEFTHDFAQLAGLTDRQLALFRALDGNQADTSRFLGVIAQTVPVRAFFNHDNIQRILSESQRPGRPRFLS